LFSSMKRARRRRYSACSCWSFLDLRVTGGVEMGGGDGVEGRRKMSRTKRKRDGRGGVCKEEGEAR
jgi:hypothetical protein